MSNTRAHKHTVAPKKVERRRQYRQAKARADRQLEADRSTRKRGADRTPEPDDYCGADMQPRYAP